MNLKLLLTAQSLVDRDKVLRLIKQAEQGALAIPDRDGNITRDDYAAGELYALGLEVGKLPTT